MDAPRVSLDCATGHTSKKNIVTLNKGQNLRPRIVISTLFNLKSRATFKQNGKAIYFN